jgi:hypothetical protein
MLMGKKRKRKMMERELRAASMTKEAKTTTLRAMRRRKTTKTRKERRNKTIRTP